MKRYLSALTIILALLLTVGCGSGASSGGGDDAKNDGFVLKAVVKSTSETDRLEVEVIESDYAFGIYWVLTNSDTAYCSADGKTVSRDKIKVGDTVEITYGGQVMMSYPPQIVASKIQKTN